MQFSKEDIEGSLKGLLRSEQCDVNTIRSIMMVEKCFPNMAFDPDVIQEWLKKVQDDPDLKDAVENSIEKRLMDINDLHLLIDLERRFRGSEVVENFISVRMIEILSEIKSQEDICKDSDGMWLSVWKNSPSTIPAKVFPVFVLMLDRVLKNIPDPGNS